jgi:outer membrane receptor protein involved in Fe transport
MTTGQSLPSPQSLISLLIIFLLVLPSAALAQTPVPAAPAAQTPPPVAQTPPPAVPAATTPAPPKLMNPRDKLKVLVLKGAEVSNFIPDRISRPVVVEVLDKNEIPVEGASVLFELPQTGPGGSFANGEHSRTVKTDLRGQAAVSFEISPEQGKFQIAVTATAGDNSGKATISQASSLMIAEEKKHEKHPWYTTKKFWIITAVAAAGATVGIILATRGGSSSSTPTIVITPGSPTFGGPN